MALEISEIDEAIASKVASYYTINADSNGNFQVVQQLANIGDITDPLKIDGMEKGVIQPYILRKIFSTNNQILIDYVIDHDVKDVNGLTYLHAMAMTGKDIEHIAHPVDVLDEKGRSPLFYAVGSNRVETARQLILLGADFRLLDGDGSSILDSCCAGNCVDIFDEIVSLIELKPDAHKFFLSIACNASGAEMVNYLLQNYDYSTEDVNTVIDRMVSCHQQFGIQTCLDGGDETIDERCDRVINVLTSLLNNFPLATIPDRSIKTYNHDHFKLIKFLAQHGVDINFTAECGCNIVQSAMQLPIEQARELFDLGLVCNNIKCSVSGIGELYWAGYFGGLDYIKLLIEHGADPSVITNSGLSLVNFWMDPMYPENTEYLKSINAKMTVEEWKEHTDEFKDSVMELINIVEEKVNDSVQIAAGLTKAKQMYETILDFVPDECKYNPLDESMMLYNQGIDYLDLRISAAEIEINKEGRMGEYWTLLGTGGTEGTEGTEGFVGGGDV